MTRCVSTNRLPSSTLRPSALSSLVAPVTARPLLALLAVGLLASTSLLPATELTGTVTVDFDVGAGTDGNGRVLMNSPNPLQPGSSISHFDPSARPNLLMEPNINPDIPPGAVDLTPHLLRDIGWTTNGGATISINFDDPAGQGFNDSSLGSARRAAVRRTADIWQGFLSSGVTINVNVKFDSLTCTQGGGAVLAFAGPDFVFTVDGAPFADTWYVGALAEAMTGENLSLANDADPDAGELSLTFNSQIDQNCLGPDSQFFYGLDSPAPPGQASFLTVALHEMAHGLGFLTLVNLITGERFNGRNDVYLWFVRDNVLRKSWAQLSAAQIQASAVRIGQVAWDGNQANRRAARFLDPSPVLQTEGPSGIETYLVSGAQFGPQLGPDLVSAALIEARDRSAQPTLACEPLRNSGEIQGKIAVVDRGDCLFIQKVRNAQNAGAVGVVVVNNVAGRITMGGTDSSLVIPAVMVSPEDGQAIRQAIVDAATDPADPDDPDEPDDPDDPDEPQFEDPSVCVADTTTLCLNGDRFRASVEWASLTDAGAGQAVELTDDTGYFWFFSAENVEVVVKVLDACSSLDRFFAFAGGLTNVEVDLTVVDTQTGLIKRYQNAQDDPFQPIQDTSTFTTCP